MLEFLMMWLGMVREGPVAEGGDTGTTAPPSDCENGAFVFPSRWEIDFSASSERADVESLALYGASMTGDPLDVTLTIEASDSAPVFSFWEGQSFCSAVVAGGDTTGGGESCTVTIDPGQWSTVTLAFSPGASERGDMYNGWLTVGWVASSGELCRVGSIFLDGVSKGGSASGDGGTAGTEE